MHALDAGSQRDIDAVVDQQRDVVLPGDLVQLLRDPDHRGRVARLVPQLDHRHTCKCDSALNEEERDECSGRTALNRSPDHRHQIPPAQNGGRVVGDKVERVIDLVLHDFV